MIAVIKLGQRRLLTVPAQSFKALLFMPGFGEDRTEAGSCKVSFIYEAVLVMKYRHRHEAIPMDSF